VQKYKKKRHGGVTKGIKKVKSVEKHFFLLVNDASCGQFFVI